MVLELIKIFDGSFGGPVLFENATYVTPNQLRKEVKVARSGKYQDHVEQKLSLNQRKANLGVLSKADPYEAVFNTAGAVADAGDDSDAAGHEGEKATAATKLKLELEKPSKGKAKRLKMKKAKKKAAKRMAMAQKSQVD